MKSKVGICPKCKKETLLTRHHIKPLRFYNDHSKNNILYICRQCHSFLEFYIPQQQKMCDSFYHKIVNLFLRSKSY